MDWGTLFDEEQLLQDYQQDEIQPNSAHCKQLQDCLDSGKKKSLEHVNEYAEQSTCRATLKLDDIKRLRVSETVSYAENFEPTKVCMALLQIFPQQPSVSCQVLSCRVMFFAIMSGTLNMDITWLQLIIQMALKFSRSISEKKIDGTEILQCCRMWQKLFFSQSILIWLSDHIFQCFSPTEISIKI